MQVGSVSVQFINDGFWSDDGGAMFGVVPKEIWSRYKPANGRNRIKMSLICPLVSDGSDLVLVDAGAGNRLGAREREAYEFQGESALESSLARLGLEPQDVAVVVLSHLHFDHCGGVVRKSRGALVPTFPRARHIVQRDEWEAALSPGDPRTGAAYAHARECLDPLRQAGLIEIIEGDTDVTANVRTVRTGGHSAGHQCVIVSNAAGGIIYLADLAPTTAHLRPGWTMAYDVNPIASVKQKVRLLSLAAEQGWWVCFDHDDSITHGRIVRKESSGALVLTGSACELV